MLKKISEKILLIIIISSLIFSLNIFATNKFIDVKEYSQAIEYLADKNIIQGTGNLLYHPNDYITIQEWTTMLGRYKNIQVEHWRYYSQEAYKLHWINWTDVQFPKSNMIYPVLLEIGFKALNIPIYDASLYGLTLSPSDNIIRISKELNINLNLDTNKLITRGEAAQILYELITTKNKIVPPPLPIIIEADSNFNLNDLLLDLQKIPPNILQSFNIKGWKCIFSPEQTQLINKKAKGITDYNKQIIYLADTSSIIHEIGHFYHWQLGFPSQFSQLFYTEAAQANLRTYAKTNEQEYFADCFAYWINYHNNSIKMEIFQNSAPQTYEYMNNIFKNLL